MRNVTHLAVLTVWTLLMWQGVYLLPHSSFRLRSLYKPGAGCGKYGLLGGCYKHFTSGGLALRGSTAATATSSSASNGRNLLRGAVLGGKYWDNDYDGIFDKDYGNGVLTGNWRFSDDNKVHGYGLFGLLGASGNFGLDNDDSRGLFNINGHGRSNGFNHLFNWNRNGYAAGGYNAFGGLFHGGSYGSHGHNGFHHTFNFLGNDDGDNYNRFDFNDK